MKMKNMLIGGMSLALVACISVGGTLAYLSDKTGEVTNTFTMGKGYVGQGLILDETALHKTGVDDDQNPVYENPTVISSSERTTTGNAYLEMNIGDAIAKDPTLKLTTGSVDSYVFVRVEGADALVGKKLYISTDTAETMMNNDENVNYTDADHTTGGQKSAFDANWVKIKELNGNAADLSKLDGYYYYKVAENNLIVTDETTMDPLFKSVLLPNDLKEVPELDSAKEIKIMGAAVQAHNVADINAAWELVSTIADFAPARG